LLAVVEAPLAVVGLASGLAMMFDPSGKDIGLSLDLLKNAPVGDFAFVGLFLFAFAGVLPAVAAYGLWTKKRWRWTDAVNKWTGQNWAWTATVTLGIVLLLWIGVELISVGPLTGIGGVMQIIITLMGLLILGLVTRPSMRFDMKLEG